MYQQTVHPAAAPPPGVAGQSLTGKRFLAKFIDLTLLLVPWFALRAIGGLAFIGPMDVRSSSGLTGLQAGGLALTIVALGWPLVFTFFNDVVGTATLQGSIGKRIVGLKYISRDGRPLGWGQGMKRWIIPAGCLSIGMLMCGLGGVVLLGLAVANVIMVISSPYDESAYDKIAGVWTVAR